MNKIIVTQEKVNVLCNSRFLKMYDLNYKEGKHYYEATRRELKDIVALKSDDERNMLIPDAVTIAVVVFLPNDIPKLLLSYEYRYPVGEFLLSPVAGLIDPEDFQTGNPLITSSIREIKEETGLDYKEETDKIYVINPCAFSSPGMTDESNAFICAEIHIDNLNDLTHNGAVGSEIFDGFELLDVEAAREIYLRGRDEKGHCFSLATWAVLGYFIGKWA